MMMPTSQEASNVRANIQTSTPSLKDTCSPFDIQYIHVVPYSLEVDTRDSRNITQRVEASRRLTTGATNEWLLIRSTVMVTGNFHINRTLPLPRALANALEMHNHRYS
jgi:hypothetical protein